MVLAPIARGDVNAIIGGEQKANAIIGGEQKANANIGGAQWCLTCHCSRPAPAALAGRLNSNVIPHAVRPAPITEGRPGGPRSGGDRRRPRHAVGATRASRSRRRCRRRATSPAGRPSRAGPTCRRPHAPRPAGPFVPRLPAPRTDVVSRQGISVLEDACQEWGAAGSGASATPRHASMPGRRRKTSENVRATL